MYSEYTPAAYYAISEDFNYRRYMEDRSHHDRTVLAITDSARELIGGANYIAETVNSGFVHLSGQLDSIQSSVKAGFDQISVQLDNIDTNIEKLSAICESGFEFLNSEIVLSNALLNRLATLLETPDQVWAKEQYDSALRCVANELWEEAIEYCTKAIEGESLHAGYKLEPLYHYLRGSIFLGGPGTESSLIDLDRALEDFNSCIRYCGKVSSELRVKALNDAAWAEYCMGRVRDAIKRLKKTDVKNESKEYARAHFLLAKFFMHENQLNEAESHFKEAIRKNEFYVIRALNDPDFERHENAILEWTAYVKEGLGKDIVEELGGPSVLDSTKRLLSIAKPYEGNYISYKSTMTTETLDELVSMLEKPLGPEGALSERVEFINYHLPGFREKLNKEVSDIVRKLDRVGEDLVRANYSGERYFLWSDLSDQQKFEFKFNWVLFTVLIWIVSSVVLFVKYDFDSPLLAWVVFLVLSMGAAYVIMLGKYRAFRFFGVAEARRKAREHISRLNQEGEGLLRNLDSIKRDLQPLLG